MDLYNPLFFYGFAFTIGVQVPDIEVDRINKKDNYASIFGEKASYQIIAVLCILATAAIYVIPHVSPSDLDYRSILQYSFFPLAASLYGFAAKRQNMEKKILVVISTIYLFIALCDAYLAMSFA